MKSLSVYLREPNQTQKLGFSHVKGTEIEKSEDVLGSNGSDAPTPKGLKGGVPHPGVHSAHVGREEVQAPRKEEEKKRSGRRFEGVLGGSMWLWVKNRYPKWKSKWKHVPILILTHTHVNLHLLETFTYTLWALRFRLKEAHLQKHT